MSKPLGETERYVVDQTIRFTRLDAGNRFEKEPGTVIVETLLSNGQYASYFIAPNLWASAVLSMSKFSERPNDWHAFMDHHQGRTDMLGAAKQVHSIKNILTHGA